MNIIFLDQSNAPDLAGALTKFETGFTYPLGAAQRFGVRHGSDYSRFFRAMGQAQCIVAMERERVVGAIAVVLRQLIAPDGRTLPAAYLGDLKIAPSARGGRVLINLARHAAAWALERTGIAFSVVMGGTAMTPDRYTGRAGLPAFTELAKLAVIRIPLERSVADPASSISADFENSAAPFCSLSAGRYATLAFAPHLRSETAPTAITLTDGNASGFIEDTRRAKRLIVKGGAEMVSAHLSHFAFRSATDGARLVRAACGLAAQHGFPALFFAVHEPDAASLLAALCVDGATVAPATVYGCGLPDNVGWNINTSEI